MARNKTQTYSFGASKREGHDASRFYSRSLYAGLPALKVELPAPGTAAPTAAEPGGVMTGPAAALSVPPRPLEEWADRIYCHTAERMVEIPDGSVALAFTSPPYNSGKDFDRDLRLEEYLGLIRNVATEVYRVLQPGGRYVVNIANLGRKPYIPLDAYFYAIHMEVGFLPAGTVIWQKGRGANGSCAWGSWCSAKAPRFRDIHESLLVFSKGQFGRPDKGESDITHEEFMAGTLSVWEIPAESAKRVGHPAPFPVALATRVIKLLSYVGDVVLDPFNGSGTTCVAAVQNHRHYVGYDISEEYCELARQRIAAAR